MRHKADLAQACPNVSRPTIKRVLARLRQDGAVECVNSGRAKKPSRPLREIRAAMDNPPSDRRLREELPHLKTLGLVSLSGHGCGASWALRRHDDE